MPEGDGSPIFGNVDPDVALDPTPPVPIPADAGPPYPSAAAVVLFPYGGNLDLASVVSGGTLQLQTAQFYNVISSALVKRILVNSQYFSPGYVLRFVGSLTTDTTGNIGAAVTTDALATTDFTWDGTSWWPSPTASNP